MSDEFIRRADAVASIQERIDSCNNYSYLDASPTELDFMKSTLYSAIDDVNETASVDVEPIVYAEWIDNHDYATCSRCNKSIHDTYCDYRHSFTRCPRCGAHMTNAIDEEVNE